MRYRPYNDFWQTIHKNAAKEKIPLRVMFELTYGCNFKCRHCYIPASYVKKYRRKELKTKEVFFILDQLKDIGCFYLGFTGGEPFLRKDIMQILRYTKEQGFEIIIYTNGSLINKKIADELKYINPNKIDITIPAMSKESFESVTGTSDSHRKVFDAINYLHNKGIRLGFKSCLLKDNESEIKDIQNFALSLNALHRLDDKLSPRLDGSKEPYRYRADSIIKSKIQNQKPKDCITKLAGKKLTTGNLFYCGVGQAQAAITPAGELKMCVGIDYPKYNILRTSLKECWVKLKKLCASIKPDRYYECHKCDLKIYCKWCPAMAWLEDKSFTTCDSESKYWARIERAL